MEQKKFYLKRDHRGVKLTPVRGFEDYLVAEDGVVYSFKTKQLFKLKEYYLEQSSGLTFKYVQLFKEGKHHKRVVHRLVYSSFNDIHLPLNKKLNFKNGNTLDCSLKNLELFEEPERTLQEGERWIEGFEGRYFIKNGEVWSYINPEYPKKLKYEDLGKKIRCFLSEKGGKVKRYYLNKI